MPTGQDDDHTRDQTSQRSSSPAKGPGKKLIPKKAPAKRGGRKQKTPTTKVPNVPTGGCTVHGPVLENGNAVPIGEQKEAHTVRVPYPQERWEEGRAAEHGILQRILGKGPCSQKTGQIGEGGQVQARDDGVAGDQTLPEVVSAVDQEVTLPETG